MLKSLTITGAGAIGAISSYEYEANQTGPPYLFHISGNVYGIAYGGPGYDGWLKTTVINDDGTFGGSIISSLEFDPDYAKNVWVTFIASNVWCLAHDSIGMLRTIRIENNGTITGEVDNHRYDMTQGLYASMLHISGDVYAIAFNGAGGDGWLKTVEIETVAPRLVINKAYALSREEL